jgi:hypothetical protein
MRALYRRAGVSNLGRMVARIREDIDRGSNFDPRIKQAIVDAISFYKTRRLGFNIKRARALLTSGNEQVSLPLDWIEADFLRLEDDGSRKPMEEVTYDWMEDEGRNDDIRGRPTKYAIQHRELRLYPIPDRSYTLVLSFQYDLQNVSLSASDGETNAWMTEGEELIRKHAMSELYVLYIDGPESIVKGQLLRRECSDEILPVLESRAAREQSSGQIRPYL